MTDNATGTTIIKPDNEKMNKIRNMQQIPCNNTQQHFEFESDESIWLAVIKNINMNKQ